LNYQKKKRRKGSGSFCERTSDRPPRGGGGGDMGVGDWVASCLRLGSFHGSCLKKTATGPIEEEAITGIGNLNTN